MDQLQALRMFVTVTEEGGFAAAARRLRTSPQAVTRGIAALEAELGTRLFHRSTRAVALTDGGGLLLAHARAIVSGVAEAVAAVRGTQSQPQGQLYVTAPVMFGRLHVLPVVQDMLRDHPALTVRLMLVDRNVRLVEEGIDVAVRIGPLADSSLKAIRIGTVEPCVVASPDYLARRGMPQSAEELPQHDIIATTEPRDSGEWRLGGRAIAIRPRLLVNTVDSALAAAEAGTGIANLLSYQVSEALRAGALVRLFEAGESDRLPVNLVFADRQAPGAAGRAFIEAMRARGGRW